MARHTSSKEAQNKANAKYKAKTYKRIVFSLRLDEDKLIIEDIEKARRSGKTCRQWLREVYYRK